MNSKVEMVENMSVVEQDVDDNGFSRKKTSRDPLSHRIIEKRRRDRMNTCLQDLGSLIPQHYLKKTEIVEMAIKYLKHLTNSQSAHLQMCKEECRKQFLFGFQECMSESIRFLVEIEEIAYQDGLCLRLVNHLQKHVSKLNTIDSVSQQPKMMIFEEMDLKNSKESDVESMKHASKEIAADKRLLSTENVSIQSAQCENLAPSISPLPAPESSARNNYKFKKNMKERFQADVQKDNVNQFNSKSSIVRSVSAFGNSGDSESMSSDSSTNTSSSFTRIRSSSLNCASSSQNMELSPPNSVNERIQSKLVLPGFILHPCETFYVPIKLNLSSSSHLFNNASNAASLNLCPVNITIAFEEKTRGESVGKTVKKSNL
ncbi:Hairy/enhancer-of-split related with YRPW motif protein 1-like protein [Dinothrombium tinctorium]|uniref:Hairy/enhancer-of-split related with YRPW motif protein 1-like protein n=1 Tax=Dinothrombium tinctorium TaxID=1965070 RepID=A0A3S3NIL1_9ACAR|nr:Hairy/enhancer-of-split related with YRPW motif protein 1-like protein [Dinothrombium tinctorium]